MLAFKELSGWYYENVAFCGWASVCAHGEVWSIHSVDKQCIVEGREGTNSWKISCV